MTTGYENAPATKMLATHCAACGRPLVDSVSVEVGMGPDCRKKYGYNAVVDEELRSQANKLIYKIALARSGSGTDLGAVQAIRSLRDLGFDKLAEICLKRCRVVVIEERGSVLAVSTPYSEEAADGFRAIPGRRWDREAKVNLVPNTQDGKRALMDRVLRRCFLGAAALGPKGAFAIA
jgi:hypothetical protein